MRYVEITLIIFLKLDFYILHFSSHRGRIEELKNRPVESLTSLSLVQAVIM